MKRTIIFFLMLITFQMFSQKIKNNLFQDENSATTENKINNAKSNMNNAFLAYSENNIEKAKYFINQSQRQGIKTGNFYFLLGAYMYRTKEFKAAKRYWKIAYKEGGCWECKELLEGLEAEQSLEELILKKVNLNLGEE